MKFRQEVDTHPSPSVYIVYKTWKQELFNSKKQTKELTVYKLCAHRVLFIEKGDGLLHPEFDVIAKNVFSLELDNDTRMLTITCNYCEDIEIFRFKTEKGSSAWDNSIKINEVAISHFNDIHPGIMSVWHLAMLDRGGDAMITFSVQR